MAGTYLPPVVITVIADDTAFLKTIAKDQAVLKAFASSGANIVLDANSTPFLDSLAKARLALLAFAKETRSARLGVDAAPFWAEIRALRTQLAAMSPLDINVEANTSAVLGQLAALRGTLALAQVGQITPAAPPSGGGRGGIVGFLGGLLGGRGGSAAGGGILSMLGFGSSASKGIGGVGAGLAGFGSIGSLLGLGAEHLLSTLLGTAGSGVGAILGGGLLGAGAAGTMAVGMGTDMAGIGQAGKDIRAVEQAQNALNQAMVTYQYDVANYGAKSAVATAALQNLQSAQANVNFTLSQVPAVARGAVLAAANTVQAFKTMFDNLTGPAEKIGAQIIQQAVQVGMAFLPTIGKYAAENMGIIKKDIQPFFSWLESKQGGTGKGFLSNLLGGKQVGGLAIFTNLEQVFQKNLPNAIKALTGGFEFFARTVDVAAQQTGGFVAKVAGFFAHMNSQAAFAGWAKTVDNLIGLFKTWLKFLFAVGKTVYDVFKPAVGAGQALVQMLTGALNVLDKWLTKASNAKALHNLFSAHLVELVQGFGNAIRAAIPLLLNFGRGFIPVLTVGAKIGTLVLKPIIWALQEIAKIPFAAQVAGWAGSLFLLGKAFGGWKLTNLTGMFSKLSSTVKGAMRSIGAIPTGVGVAKLSVQDFANRLFSTTGGMLGVIGGFGLLGAAAVTWALSMKSSYQKAESAGKSWAQTFAASVAQTTMPLGAQISVIQQNIASLNSSLLSGIPALGASSSAISAYRNQYALVQGKVAGLKAALAGLQTTQASQDSQLSLSTGSNASFANSMQVLTGATSAVNSAMSTYSSYLDTLAGNQQTVTGLTLTMASDLNQVTSDTAKGTVALNGNNAASITLQQGILGIAQTLMGQLMPAWAKQGQTVPQITQNAQGYINKLNAMLKSLGYTPAAIDAMDAKMGLTPQNVDAAAQALKSMSSKADLATKAMKNLVKQPWQVTVNNSQAMSALAQIGAAVSSDLAGFESLNLAKMSAGAAAGLGAASTIAGQMPYLGQLSGLSGHSVQVSNSTSVVIHAGGANPGQTSAAVQQAIDSSNAKLIAKLRAGSAW